MNNRVYRKDIISKHQSFKRSSNLKTQRVVIGWMSQGKLLQGRISPINIK